LCHQAWLDNYFCYDSFAYCLLLVSNGLLLGLLAQPALEYEYDLMDNVTQRQNHISGLSEGFTYDALDRLTQSSTTGKIDDVDYSYAVSYQYDINGGDGGVITTSCLHFLVTASIGTVGEGCRVCAFSELLWFVERCPSNGLILR
jgi:hypothetical protein